MILKLNPNQDPIVVPNATTTSAGAMSAEDKEKLDSISPSAGYPAPTSAALAISGGNYTVDGTVLNRLWRVALASSGALVISNPTDGETYQLKMTVTGSPTLTLPGNIQWASGSAYTPTTDGVDFVTLVYDETNNVFEGFFAQDMQT